jgi:transglutaminase-like putative cysteine protease
VEEQSGVIVRRKARHAVWLGILVLGFLAAGPRSASADSPYIYKLLKIEYDVEPNGLFTQTTHGEVTATTVGAAGDLGQLPIDYSESMEELDVVEAYTLKANGRKLPVNASAIFSQLPNANRQYPMFTDMRQKVVVFPQVSVNDTIVWTARTRLKQPRFPGQFSTQEVFPRTTAFENVEVVIRAPKTLPLAVETHGLAFKQETQGNTVVYRWTYAAPQALNQDEAALSVFDRSPRLFASSFKNYDEFGRAYYDLGAGRIAVTPKVQALADEITAGAANRREQAQRLYEWVSRNIRYVAVYLGNGGLVPHDPDTVIDNGYGDCKDHTVLYASLLKAKGIDSEIAMINLGNAYTLSKVPTLAQLNHVVNWLPEFALYADTTAGVANFATLPLEEYGKPAVHAVPKGQALRAIPVLPKDRATSTIRTVAKLSNDGKITGRTITAATGVLAIPLRQFGMWVQSVGPERTAKMHLEALRLQGKGAFEAKPSSFNEDSHSIVGRFEVEMSPRVTSGESFVPPVGLQAMMRPGYMLMGPIDQPDMKDDEKTPCYSGRQTEEVSLELPAGKRIASLPKEMVIQNDNLRYTSRWAEAGQFVTVRREFTSSMSEALCSGRVRGAAAVALRQIRDDYRTAIALINR